MSAQQIRSLFASMPDRLAKARRKFGRPLTLTDKILVAHCWDFERQTWDRGKAILKLRVDRVAMQDVTGRWRCFNSCTRDGSASRSPRRSTATT